MSLRQKILFGIIAIYSLTLTVLAILLSLDQTNLDRFNREQRDREVEQFNELWADRFAQVSKDMERKLEIGDVRPLLEWSSWRFLEDPVLFSALGGEEIFINPAGAPDPDRPFDSDRIRDRIKQAIERRDFVRDGNYAAYRLSEHTGVWFKLPLATDIGPVSRINARAVFILMVIGIPLMTLISYALLTRVVIRPLEQLQEANRRVAGGDYSLELPARRGHGGDEMDVLFGTFNSMLRDVRDYHHNLEQRVQEATEKIRSAERRLVTAQRLAATGKLAAGIAHEINNPLGGMINIARNLQTREYDAEKQAEYLELILDGLERIQAIVQKMLPLSIREVQPQDVDLRKVLHQVRELVQYRIRSSASVRLDLELAPGELTVFGDPHELHQVYLNLAINALDALGEDGGRVVIRARADGSWITSSVEDDGAGMSEEQIQQAFDLFFTTKDAGEGTGLGLSIVHNIVDNHGGSVSIRSGLGEGTCVEVRLPCAGRPASQEMT